MYKNQKTYKPSNWVGTVMLKMCEVLERPSKKGGFCFKLFHPLDHPIWAPKVDFHLFCPKQIFLNFILDN